MVRLDVIQAAVDAAFARLCMASTPFDLDRRYGSATSGG
jgi:hypothetical protein